jgi:hypothetical protein
MTRLSSLNKTESWHFSLNIETTGIRFNGFIVLYCLKPRFFNFTRERLNYVFTEFLQMIDLRQYVIIFLQVKYLNVTISKSFWISFETTAFILATYSIKYACKHSSRLFSHFFIIRLQIYSPLCQECFFQVWMQDLRTRLNNLIVSFQRLHFPKLLRNLR